MNMKKVLMAVVLVVLISGMVSTVCAGSLGFGDLFNSIYGSSSSSIPKNIRMPDQFSITYEYTDSGKFREVTMEKDRSGNYHYRDSENEYLFVKAGSGYRIAIGTVNGFAYKNEEKYTLDYIKTLSSRFWDCATPDVQEIEILGTVSEDGTGEVCGRKTDRFKVELGMSYSVGGYGMSMSEGTFYDFDHDTGICLASSSSGNVSAFGLNMSDDSDDNFECIHFELKNVTLPSVE